MKRDMLYLFSNIDVDTPTVSDKWVRLSEEKKIEEIGIVLKQNNLDDIFKVTRVSKDGSVYIQILSDLEASKRGLKLLNLEELLKSFIDVGLVVWCEPLGDRNSLRKLRGITIKSGEEF